MEDAISYVTWMEHDQGKQNNRIMYYLNRQIDQEEESWVRLLFVFFRPNFDWSFLLHSAVQLSSIFDTHSMVVAVY